jgi:hypothetical protein
VCHLLTRSPAVQPSRQLCGALFIHFNDSIAWALLSWFAHMPGGLECHEECDKWIIEYHSKQFFTLLFVLIRNRGHRPRTDVRAHYPAMIALVQALADAQVVTSMPAQSVKHHSVLDFGVNGSYMIFGRPTLRPE